MGVLRFGILVGLAIACRELWGHRDKEQVEALVGVARKRPVMYRVTLKREPLVRIEGDGARIVGVKVDNAATAFQVVGPHADAGPNTPRMVPDGKGGTRPAKGKNDYGSMPA